MTYRDVIKKLGSLGCHEMSRRRGGSHRNWINPAQNRIATIPDWGARDLKIGTLRSAIRRLGINWDDFMNA